MKEIIYKTRLYFSGLMFFLSNKVKYGKHQFNASFCNAINGRVHIKIASDGKLHILNKLRVDGPLYLCCIGQLDIGDNCYFNHIHLYLPHNLFN